MRWHQTKHRPKMFQPSIKIQNGRAISRLLNSFDATEPIQSVRSAESSERAHRTLFAWTGSLASESKLSFVRNGASLRRTKEPHINGRWGADRRALGIQAVFMETEINKARFRQHLTFKSDLERFLWPLQRDSSLFEQLNHKLD